MSDRIDALFKAAALTPPPGFADRMAALAHSLPQLRPEQKPLRPWQWITLGASAGLGSLALCQFILFAFLTAAAQ